jgi:hypothetical protein
MKKMKFKKIFMLSCLVTFSASLKAQIKEKTQFAIPTAPHTAILKPQITKLNLGVDSLGHSDIYFAGVILYSGQGMVYYQWVNTPPQTSPLPPTPYLIKDSIMLGGSSREVVHYVAHKYDYSTHIVKLEITSPVSMSSNIQHY